MRFLFFILLLLIPAVSLRAEETPVLLYDFQGDVFILKESASEWFPAKKSDVLKVGDTVWAGKESFAELALDKDYRNLLHVEQNTKAEIRSLDPADIYLEDGTIYSALDGLQAGQFYSIVTPTAVASARGTHFYAEYQAAQQQSEFALMPHEDNVQSELTVQAKIPEAEGAKVILREGEEALFSPKVDAPQVQKVSEQKKSEEKALLEAMNQRVEAAKSKSEDIDLIFINPADRKSP